MTRQASPDEIDKMSRAQVNFEQLFGMNDETKTSIGLMGAEEVIIVENDWRRAFYSFDVELLKVINLTGTED